MRLISLHEMIGSGGKQQTTDELNGISAFFNDHSLTATHIICFSLADLPCKVSIKIQ